MRTILMATLALAPVLVHAQSQSPAPTRTTNAPVLESKLVTPNAVDGAAAPSAIVPTSTLLQPKLIKWTNIAEDRNWQESARNQERSFKVSMTVTESGVPTGLKVVDSADPLLNQSVLEAVANYRFTPASLDSKPTAVPLVLTVRVLPQSK